MVNWSTAGRDHIHHKLMEKLFCKRHSLGNNIANITVITGFLGIIIEIFSHHISTFMFFVYASFYYIYAYGFGKISKQS